MSKQFYWGVLRKTGHHRVWPQRFHFRYNDAKHEAFRQEGIGWRKKFVIQRFIFEMQRKGYYDVYKHTFKKI